MANLFRYKWKVFLIIAVLILWAGISIHPFLACNKPVAAEILVVEGWLPEPTLKKAFEEFKSENYKYIVTTGGAIRKGGADQETWTYAEFAALSMISFGLDRNLVIPVFSENEKRHRTFSCAMALKKWFIESRNNIKAVNIYTYGAHARKSLTIYERVLSPLRIEVGVISSPPFDYDSRKWFLSERGIKWVVRDSIGYVYALVYPFQL